MLPDFVRAAGVPIRECPEAGGCNCRRFGGFMLSKRVEFRAAVPVWPGKYIDEMNISIVMKAEFAAAGKRILRIAASSCYQIFADGDLFEMGPARAGHGYFRVDELELPDG